MNLQPLLALLSLIASIVGGGVGAYLGMKIGLVRLETWKDMAHKKIEALDETVGLLKEDSLVHDMEIDGLMSHAGMVRVRRQRLRD